MSLATAGNWFNSWTSFLYLQKYDHISFLWTVVGSGQSTFRFFTKQFAWYIHLNWLTYKIGTKFPLPGCSPFFQLCWGVIVQMVNQWAPMFECGTEIHTSCYSYIALHAEAAGELFARRKLLYALFCRMDLRASVWLWSQTWMIGDGVESLFLVTISDPIPYWSSMPELVHDRIGPSVREYLFYLDT